MKTSNSPNNSILRTLKESKILLEEILRDENLIHAINQTGNRIVSSLDKGGKILICGNGGSASQAEHLAAEFTGRFSKNRRPLFAEALTANSSEITAIANDFSFDEVFSRLVEAKGRPGDVLIAISTSGNSANIIRALEKAWNMGIYAILWTGTPGGKATEPADLVLKVPTADTARIQECHLLIGHIVCQMVEDTMFPG